MHSSIEIISQIRIDFVLTNNLCIKIVSLFICQNAQPSNIKYMIPIKRDMESETLIQMVSIKLCTIKLIIKKTKEAEKPTTKKEY